MATLSSAALLSAQLLHVELSRATARGGIDSTVGNREALGYSNGLCLHKKIPIVGHADLLTTVRYLYVSNQGLDNWRSPLDLIELHIPPGMAGAPE
jgi:hypothetical protein